MSDAKKTGQSDFAENTKSLKKIEVPFKNKLQIETGLVFMQLISKGRIP